MESHRKENRLQPLSGLVDPAAHEPLADEAWSEPKARDAIARIAADAEQAFDERALWQSHPLDEEPDPLPPIASVFLGASGVIWALVALARDGAVELRRSWDGTARGLHERYLATPDFPEEVGGAVPSLWDGESGILLVAHALAPSAEQEERLLACVRANAANPTRELMWGSPGTMLAAQLMLERTGDERFSEAWGESADRLWEEWRDEVWLQELGGTPVRYLGPAHGFAGNVFALARGDLLERGRRAELERRTIAVVSAHAERADGLAQWPISPEHPIWHQDTVRTQWCHGAPGIVASLASLAPGEVELTELLAAGGELTWRAGPLAKGPGLCHGTAGNGYAFLKLFERTGDELWLVRARAFAMHALAQVEWMRTRYGRGRHTLWTGDPGAALYAWSCVAGTADVPTLDRF
ncbi:MAG TPA: LanC-like protein [Gaiellaceae bacterium]